jgi:hypothetical protein
VPARIVPEALRGTGGTGRGCGGGLFTRPPTASHNRPSGESGGKRSHSFTSGTLATWLPGVLEIEATLPDQRIRIFEWYVPIDESRHDYVQVLTKRCADEPEAAEFRRAYEERWRDLFHLGGFGDDDVLAREAMQEAYEDEQAWRSEHLTKPDRALLTWRRLVHEHARGFQPPPTAPPARGAVD